MNNQDFGKLILRLTMGGLMLFHGIAKLMNGVGGIENMLADKGLPTFIAYGVFVGEVIAPIMMIFGVRTRLAALIFTVNMVVATWLAHADEIWQLTDRGIWAIEYQALFLFGGLAIFFLGAGKLSFSSSSRWD